MSTHLCFHFKGLFSKWKASNIHANKFFEEFVCGALKKHEDCDDLVKWEMDGERSILHFTDVDQVNSIYVETGHKAVIRNYFKNKKNYVKSKAKKITDNGTGSLRRVSKGVKHMNNKKYLKYEVEKPSELWRLLSANYKVQTITKKVTYLITGNKRCIMFTRIN